MIKRKVIKKENKFEPYDLLNQDRVIRGRMPILEIIYERFIRAFRVSLSNSLRAPATISIISTDLLKFGEFVNTLPIPSCTLLLRMNELQSPALVVFESKLSYSFIDKYFGGTDRPFKKIEGKEFTMIELSFMRKIMDMVIMDLEEAWAPVHRIDAQYLRTEINPQFIGVCPPSEIVIATTLEVEFESCSGTMMFVLPYSGIEPIKKKLQSCFQTDRYTESAFRELPNLPVEVKGVIKTKDLSLGVIKNLKIGQIIPIENEKPNELDVSIQIEGEEQLKGTITEKAINKIIIKEKK